jgi:G:T-mismatch repair DNA endonuclease (very short patch repair protein)
MCGIVFERKRADVHNITFCSTNCRNLYMKNNNPNPIKEKIKVECAICNEQFVVNKAKYENQDNFFCSRKCYNDYRHIHYNKDKIYNYQNLIVDCAQCGKELKTCSYDISNRNNLFCSQECYWEHRRNNYSKLYFINNLSSKETKPEKLVREYLENKNIKYYQNLPMFRRYYVDFYLKDYKTIIEVNGDYWHSNPKIYSDNKKTLNEFQEYKIQKDIDRENYIRSKGYNIYVIWECDIYENLEYYMGDILDCIKIDNKKNPQRLHAMPFCDEQKVKI